jgi:3-methyladenine DNA glycosylase AlkD
MTSWSDDAVGRVVAAFEPARDAAKAVPMAAYMKDRFAFLGLPTPVRLALQRTALAGLPRPGPADALAAADLLWARPEREYQYVACDQLDRAARQLERDDLAALGRLVTTKSWWDSVDSLRRPIGVLVLGHVDLLDELRRWNADEDIWLIRSSIILQLGWNEHTDEAFLFEMCANRATHPGFFVRKAIGWALRQHARLAPEAVVRFVDEHPELSGLSKREALRRIGVRA